MAVECFHSYKRILGGYFKVIAANAELSRPVEAAARFQAASIPLRQRTRRNARRSGRIRVTVPSKDSTETKMPCDEGGGSRPLREPNQPMRVHSEGAAVAERHLAELGLPDASPLAARLQAKQLIWIGFPCKGRRPKPILPCTVKLEFADRFRQAGTFK